MDERAPRPTQSPESSLRVYVFIRTDLPRNHQLVQAVHAGIQAAAVFDFPEPAPNLVVLKVADASALARAVTSAREHAVPITAFYESEPEWGYTAAATSLLSREQSKIFRDYRLWQ